MNSDTSKTFEACPMCESEHVTSHHEKQTFTYGDGAVLSADVIVHTCDDCGFVYTDEQAEDAQHDAVCRYLGVLTPSEIKDVRNLYGMSRAQFARAFGFGEASLDRWENGLKTQNVALDNLLFLLTDPAVGEKLAKRERGVPLIIGTVQAENSESVYEAENVAEVVVLNKFRGLSGSLQASDRAVKNSANFSLRREYFIQGDAQCM